MALVSPGVQVSVINESFYTPAAAGTVPMIFVASASNKANSSGTGIARGTLKSNAGRPFLVTSQREFGELFGDPLFYSDQSGNMIHAGELNEYGLQAAYSLLGVTNRVYVTRTDFDLGKLQPSAVAPGGEPRDGSYWFDTAATVFGALEWNASPARTPGGQSFTSIEPIVITDSSRVDSGNAPRASIGSIGDYALVAVTNLNKLFYKNSKGDWVQVGSPQWAASWPVATYEIPAFNTTSGFDINGNTVEGNSLSNLINDINGNSILQGAGITAEEVTDGLAIFSTGITVVISDIANLPITGGTFWAPRVAIAPHTQVPEFKSIDPAPRPTGSIWLKTTPPNQGANFRVKIYNGDTQLWQDVSAPIYTSGIQAIRQLDPTGGGINLRVGDLYVKANDSEETNPLANFRIYRRIASGETRITGARINNQLANIGTGDLFIIRESRVDGTFSDPVEIAFTGFAGVPSDAETIAAAINSTPGLINVVAEVDGLNRLVIKHRLGGEIRINDVDGILNDIGFTPTGVDPTTNLYSGPGVEWTASLWAPLVYEASATEPLALTTDGEIWFNSITDEVDIMIHNGTTWVGYKNGTSGNTDDTGPIVSASEPTSQRDGSVLEDGDLWIDTADIDNYPTIYRYRKTGTGPTDIQEWILLDKTDQTTENGVLFADARWSTAGESSEAASIVDLLTSDYLDPDAPDPALYPKGMLLWNLRRSGFNVKRFERNYINTGQSNGRFGDETMSDYYPHRWVTDSPNQEDGSGSFGRIAQRSSVVKALKAMVNSNQDIRDEEARQFNLMACPGYPELIQPMITLNFDRRLTSFVVGDTPFRLAPDATSLNEWATNVRRALETNEVGLVAFDEYFAIYYGAGFTSDNSGNNVVVPPSHMALRVLVLNDQVAFPWFAPAGTRRGGVTNATSSGFVTSEGEFVSVALNTGQRDTLYSNGINPITFLAGSGLVVYGQKTRARQASALDRINVARLIVYMRGQLERLARPYLFEPNDKITRDQIKAAADAFCLELVSLRALFDFLVVCDETNNTPARIDRNELYLDIAIEPVKAVEFIYIPLRIKNTGEIAGL
jgi:hypothetical protein